MDNDELDQSLTALIGRGLTLPRERIEVLHERIAAEIRADAEAEAWSAFTYVMTHLGERWRPVREWATYPAVRIPTAA